MAVKAFFFLHLFKLLVLDVLSIGVLDHPSTSLHEVLLLFFLYDYHLLSPPLLQVFLHNYPLLYLCELLDPFHYVVFQLFLPLLQ
mmetsp:Transcript_15455/g.15053  ORF Transcript_15455/g.15053 Transcript_15455/m.15053 type:complete len:85 (-) Transcript_15455:107-361(-)